MSNDKWLSPDRDGFIHGNSGPELICLPEQTPESAARSQEWRDKYLEFIDEHLVFTFCKGKMTIYSDGEEYNPSDDDTMKA